MENQPISSYALIDLSNKLSQLIQEELSNKYLHEQILQELLDRRDEGKEMYGNGTLSTTQFTVIDLVEGTSEIGTGNIGGSPGHPVKGYAIKNTGKTTMLFAHNITLQPQLDLDVTLDALKANPIFTKIEAGAGKNMSYNVNCIRSIHLIALTGTPTYEITLFW